MIKINFTNFTNIFTNNFIALLLLIITNFIAHFWLFQNFGIYEDDHFRIPMAMEMNAEEIKQLIQNNLLQPEYTQGRPLHIIFIYLFSYLGAKIGGLNGVYIFAFLLTNINLILIYSLLWRVYNNKLIALIGSLCFILFPADTTKIWLTSLFGLQTSITFLLIAFHLYLSSQLIINYLSYFVILLALITYETPFLVFATAPLLKYNNHQKNKFYFHIVKHNLILLLIIILITLWRRVKGESRVSNIEIGESIKKSLYNIFTGTGVSFKSFFESSWNVLTSINSFTMVILIFAFTLMYILFIQFNYQQKNKKILWHRDLKIIIIGILMLLLAYPLTLNLSASETHGTWSRIHLASRVGISFLGAGLSALFIDIAQKFNFKIISFFLISFLFSLPLSYGILIQKDYALNWQHQKEFWQEITPLLSDLEDGDLVFFDRENINISTKEMRSNHWSTAPILNNLYHFPSDWKYLPQVYLLSNNWQENIIAGNNLFLLNPSTLEGADALLPSRSFDSTISSKKVIFIKSVDGKLTRITSPLTINNQTFQLKNNSTIKNNFSHKYLSKLMLP